MIEKQHAQMLAALACAARPARAPRWDAPGVMAAIAHVRHMPLHEVAIATFRAAADASLTTPGAIANTTTSCWRSPGIEAAAASREPYDQSTTCSICGRTRARCEANPHGDHDFESQAEMRQNRRGGTDPEPPTDDDPLFAYLDRKDA